MGETLTLQYTIRPDDGHGSPPVGDGVVTIHITGTNDAPVITSGPGSGSVTENVASVATGTMAAFDPDNGAQKFWTVVGGTARGGSLLPVRDGQFRDHQERQSVLGGYLWEWAAAARPHRTSPMAPPPVYIVNGGFQEAGRQIDHRQLGRRDRFERRHAATPSLATSHSFAATSILPILAAA